MSVAQLERDMPHEEFVEWALVDQLEAEERREREKTSVPAPAVAAPDDEEEDD